MKKAIILSALAILSLVLSYFYEVAPANRPAPAQAGMITPYAINTPEDVLQAIEWQQPLPEEEAEELQEEYYIKKLGLRFRNPDYRALVEAASKWIGTPYRYGSSSKRGADCSGFVTSLYEEVYGINLSRSSRSMFQDVARIQKDSVRTGDLVFFRRSANGPIFHVGIYLKNNKFIHSATSKGVMVSSLSEPYFRSYYFAAGRVN
ncbi:C40 family peptidase [Pontibacter anaerobius]|uniref:NlpC/P60 family protein n=1 Tax=Pontibacter anaerobius TaxID=2993940 RepID=A0ABT3RLE8_9BACT|nr:NlpC/P60 family protein [Pontibacter anaerobius]MCX2742015.1 NlpC/P60 family protein [Pontibacter anaerobius]